MIEFPEFEKIARLRRECVISEKIDGTNGLIQVSDDGSELRVGSRTKWITPTEDNFGFARWAIENQLELLRLGPGNHYGEWWGSGIQRRYDQKGKIFSLFDTARWSDAATRPLCCSVVPVLYQGLFETDHVGECLALLRERGSVAAPGFMKPEGVVVYHTAARIYFKATLEKDEEWKGKAK